MSLAKKGDTVLVSYTGKLSDGTVFESTAERGPLQVKLGQQDLMPGIESSLLDMSPGETATATLPVLEAFGPHKPDLVLDMPRDRIPTDVDIEIGNNLELKTAEGQAIPARVLEVSDESVRLDANHPLAGKDLFFELELLEIVEES